MRWVCARRQSRLFLAEWLSLHSDMMFSALTKGQQMAAAPAHA